MFGSAAPSSYVAAQALIDIPIVRFLGFCWSPPQRTSLKECVGRLIGSERILSTPRSRGRAPSVPLFDRNDLGTVQIFLERERPDLILSCGFPKLIPNPVLELAQHAINIHPGLLPQRAGGTPVRWAVRLGDSEYGVTAHYMTDRFDAGDIVFQETMPLPPDTTTGEAEAALDPHVARIVGSIVRKIERGEALNRKSQVAEASMPSLRGHRQFVDWQADDAASIRRLCNAMRPRSGALARSGARTIVLWDVEPGGVRSAQCAAGTVSDVGPEGPTIATRGGSMVVRKALIGGRVRAGAMLKLHVGDQLS